MTEIEPTPDLGDEMDRAIGRNLRRTRELKGISQAELARLATTAGLRGFHQTTVARIESGQRSMRAAEALALARVLETSLDRLAENEENSTLREHIAEVIAATERYDLATRDLMRARVLAAGYLDRLAPYGGADYLTHEAILSTGLDPNLYEHLERRLVGSSPEMLLQALLHAVGVNPPAEYRFPGHGARVQYLLDEYRGGGE
ncbi:helix-turn-helix transcriptional regulator [Microbacterium sp. BWR-S6Y]|uniref:helix-turn-helix transcriptional regulator n=1 Tax=Microbacterium sp. BWR-S6Y TaxID=3232073 RepID=UPI003528EF27